MSFDIAIRRLTVEQLDFYLKNSKRTSVLLDYDFKDLTHSSFGFVKETIPQRYATGSFEQLFMDAFKDRGVNVFHYDIRRISNNDAMMFLCWLQDELEVIKKLEETYLSGEPDIDLQAAGIDQLNQLGITNVLDSLANGDVTKWNEIRRLPYSVVFDKQYKGVIESRIQKRLVEIRNERQKQKR